MFTIMKTMPCRRNVSDMTNAERAAFVNAVKSLKAAGGYDPFVLTHQQAMDTATPSGSDPRDRNAAHRGPSFPPWHREFLIRLEDDLRAINSSVAIPYWDWATDAALPDPRVARSGPLTSWEATATRETATSSRAVHSARANGWSSIAVEAQPGR